MSANTSIPPRRDDCAIEALGHHPNAIQVMRIASPQRRSGAGLSIRCVEIRPHIDDLGFAGIYRLHHDGGTREVFDHDPDRLAAVLAQEAEQPVDWTPSGMLFVGRYCFSVAPIERLEQRTPCGENPWARWLAGETEERPIEGGFLIPGQQALARFGPRGEAG